MDPRLVWIIFAGIVMGGVLWSWLQRKWRRFRLKWRFARAQRKEAEAESILQEYGYNVLGSQVEGSIMLLKDGEELFASLRADYLVERSGRTFIAEAKSGNKVTNVLDRGTRRQLLEYLVSYDVDGVLLVDTEKGEVSEVFFPMLAKSQIRTRFSLGLFIGVAFGFLLCLLAQGYL